MSVHLKQYRGGFGPGRTPITTLQDETGIALSVIRWGAGTEVSLVAERETAWLLMDGCMEVCLGEQPARIERTSLFDDLPSCVHAGAGTPVALRCVTDIEVTTYEVANKRPFSARIYHPDDVRDEHRGKGQVKDACYRFVRTILDRSTTPEDADLVLGEVVTLPGRWSSYPPHHHLQPEIYHYRFTEPQGYGHAELGDEVLKVRHNDTVKILHPLDHPQTAAPGYGMYYAWVIRHLPGAPYDTPEFAEEHRWVMDPDAELWWPKGVE